MWTRTVLATTTALLIGCAGRSQTADQPGGQATQETAATDSAVTIPTETTAEPLPTQTLPPVTLPLVEDAEPQRIKFEAADGTLLVGTYWPPRTTPAPGVLLMHWNPGDRTDWSLLAALLQGQALAEPTESARGSYAVFAFDFRAHGESGGSADRSGYLKDAEAALTLLREIPGVNRDRIVLIGASIGADAAVDACSEGCIGAISLSPGGHLGLPYRDALVALGDKPVLCVAGEGDAPSAEACRAGEQAGLSDYQMQVYQGSAHGKELFDLPDQEPALIDLIFEWLAAHVP